MDPLGIVASLNQYAYVDSQPLTLFDPSGLLSIDRESCKSFGGGDAGGPECCFPKLQEAARKYSEFFQPGWRKRHPKCWQALASKSGRWRPMEKGRRVLSPLSCMVAGHRHVTVRCNPGAGSQYGCGGTDDKGNTFFGPNACNSDACGTPLNTLFHEQLHRCGAPPEKGGLITEADDIAYDCVGR